MVSTCGSAIFCLQYLLDIPTNTGSYSRIGMVSGTEQNVQYFTKAITQVRMVEGGRGVVS